MIVEPPRNTTVMLGRPAVMECMAEGQPKPLVSWSRQGKGHFSGDWAVVFHTNHLLHKQMGHWDMVSGWQREAAIMGWLQESQCTRVNEIYCLSYVSYSRPWYKWSVSVFTSDSHLSIKFFLWQIKARELNSTTFNARLALSDQTGSPFPLMWLSSRQTWWLGTRGVTTLAFMCAEPTSRRPENLLPPPLSFTCLVESFYALNYLSFSLVPKFLHHQLHKLHFWCLDMKSRNS